MPTLAESLADYFLTLTTLNKNNFDNNLRIFANKIENEILKGKVDFDEKDRKLYYTPKDLDLEIEITKTSSMVAELSPITLFLKYRSGNLPEKIEFVKDGNTKSSGQKERFTIIIFEEPEAHLHPEIQVKLMEILAEISKLNVKLIITSHSNYMFNKLSNLILDDKIKSDNVEIMHIVMTEKGSIDKEDMRATNEGIDDFNFSEISEDLYDERMKLYEKLNDKEDVTGQNKK